MEFLDLTEKYKKATNRLILLDYDGTLVDYKPLPLQAFPEPEVLDTLYGLSQQNATKLVIVTGRASQDIDRLVGHLPVDIIAEHGAEIKEKETWTERIHDDVGWKTKVLPLLDKLSSTCPNSFIEEKQFSVGWHYRNCDPENGRIHSRVLINVLEIFIQSYDLEIFDGNKLVEITTKKINKGKAIGELIRQSDYDFILCMGDDVTDEYMFRYLSNDQRAYSVKVGEQETEARYRVNNSAHAIEILKKLTQ